MLKIYNIIDKEEYLEEIVTLTINEWGKIPNNIEELNTKINKKIRQIKENYNNPYYCKLILLDDDKLIGFISIFPCDLPERKDLTPWYATMYVKE